MFHSFKAVVALAKARNDTVFQETLGLNAFHFAADDHLCPLDNMQMVGKSNGWAMKGQEPKLTKLAPHWSLGEVAEHAVDFWLTAGHVPFRCRPSHVGPRREQQCPRARQPLRRRHELPSQHRSGEPGLHRDGQRDPRR